MSNVAAAVSAQLCMRVRVVHKGEFLCMQRERERRGELLLYCAAERESA